MWFFKSSKARDPINDPLLLVLCDELVAPCPASDSGLSLLPLMISRGDPWALQRPISTQPLCASQPALNPHVCDIHSQGVSSHQNQIQVLNVKTSKCQVTKLCLARSTSKWQARKYPSCTVSEGQGRKEMEETLTPGLGRPQELNPEKPFAKP